MKARTPLPKYSTKRLAAIADGTYKPKPKTPLPRYSAKRAAVLAENPRAFDKPKVAIRKVKQSDGDRAGLILQADIWFSRFIRNRVVIGDRCQCFTCGIWLLIKRAHCGHFIDRAHMATRFLEENAEVQCPRCNQIHNDNQQPYKDALEAKQKGLVEYLEDMGKRIAHISTSELLEMIEKYKNGN